DSTSIETMVAKMVAEHINLEKSVNFKKLTLACAKTIALDVEAKAREMGINVVVSIVDEGTNLMLLEAMDSSYLASVNISWNKAYTAVSLKMPTETVGELSKEGGALEGLVPNGENRIMFLAGGCPLKIGEHIMGGIGVSGGTAEEDKLLAHFGAELFKKYM
ncbi:MAG: heme-binding protein, partial [Carnobacterium sp.]